jgi:transposase-like protein
MRLPASEKLEIIHLVEQSHLPARRTLEMLGIKPSTFYRWYDRFRSGGPEALEDRPSKPDRVWNRIPDEVRQGTVRNSVCEAIMMEGKGASYGYRERPAGPTFSWA